MAEVAVSSAAKRIGQLLADEGRYLDSVSEKVKVLQSELEWMQCFLKDADEKRHTQAVVQKWVSQIKEHAFDAEDIIENYLLKVSPHNRYIIEKIFSRRTILRYLCICRDAIVLHGIGLEIDALTEKLSKLTKRLRTYGVIAKDNSPCDTSPLQRTYFFQKDEAIVGMEEDIKTLKDFLVSNNSSKKVIAVCGMGGLGKTAIARKVYNDVDVRSCFGAFSWVHISQKFNKERIVEAIKDELTSKMDENMKKKFKRQGPEVLCELMTKMKCLVVIDDTWKSTDFDSLRVAFPIEKEESASKVILTTRNDRTTEGLNSDLVFLHKLRGLQEDKALELFTKKAFPNNQTCPVLFPDLAKEMLKHCRGVPLAIITLAAVLKTKQTKEEWEAVRNNIGLHLRKGKDQNLSYKNVHDVLSMSYDNLQSHLKQCFLYLAAFPGDYEIETEKLYQLWIADGIVASANIYGEQLKGEEVGEIYLNELVSKNMVEVVQRSPKGKVEKFVLHDLMQDMCVAKAKEESFLHVVFHSNKQPMQEVSAISNDLGPAASRFNQKVRRLVVNVDREATMSILSSSSATRSRIRYVRSLMFFRTGDICSKDEDCTTLVINISKDFPLLRVLYFEEYGVKGNLPKEVRNMIHLRYLRLKGTYIDRLPTSIGELHLLQTLDLRVRSDMISLPNILWKLNLLKHLYLPDFDGLTLQESGGSYTPKYKVRGGESLRLDGLSNLETLMNVDLDTTSVEGVNIANLKRFRACATEKVTLFAGSESKKMLEMSLRIHPGIITENPTVLFCESLKSAEIHSVDDENVLLPPLDEKMFHKNLDTLHIWYCTLQADPMPVLEKLESLTTLGLHKCYDGDVLRCRKDGFPKLRFLFLDFLLDLKELNVEEGALPSLQNFTTWRCDQLSIIPTAIPSSVSVVCFPCVTGVERHAPCPYANSEFSTVNLLLLTYVVQQIRD